MKYSTMDDITACVACGSNERGHVKNWRGFEIAQCHECGLQYTVNPQRSRKYVKHS